MKINRKNLFTLIFSLPLIAAVFFVSEVCAGEEVKKTSSSSSKSSDWVKTGAARTDSLTYENQKKMIADAVKANREKIAKEKAEAAAKEKLWQETKAAEAEKLAAEKTAAEKAEAIPAKKNKLVRAPQPKDKNKSASGRSRVFVS